MWSSVAAQESGGRAGGQVEQGEGRSLPCSRPRSLQRAAWDGHSETNVRKELWERLTRSNKHLFALCLKTLLTYSEFSFLRHNFYAVNAPILVFFEF